MQKRNVCSTGSLSFSVIVLNDVKSSQLTSDFRYVNAEILDARLLND